jgi:hypothetical protein
MSFFDDKDLTKTKLFNWIESLIHVRDVETRMEYVTIYDLVKNTLENGEDEIVSTLEIDGVTYKFNMKLFKMLDSPRDVLVKCLESLD